MFVIKFCIYFSLSFLILSIPVGNKQVFTYIHGAAEPYTNQIFSSIKGAINNGLRKPSNISVIERSSKAIDRVKNSSAAKAKKTSSKTSLPKDNYTPEERQALLRVLSQSVD